MTETEKRHTGLLDELAKLEHEQWKSWVLNIIDTENITPERTKRWLDLVERGWGGFTEEERDKDREWAERVLWIIQRHMGIK